MRILNIIQCTELGGMEQASLRLMTGLQKRGHSCRVLSVNPLGRLAPALSAHDIPAAGVPFRGRLGWRSHFKLRRAIRKELEIADSLLMTGPTLSGILSLKRRRTMPRVLAVHFHHTGVKPPWAWRGLYRLVTSRFDAVTFPSDFIRDEAEALWPPLKAMSHTVRNPLPLPELPDANARDAARRSLDLPPNAPIVGNAGWLIPRKRFDVFLQTAAAIHKVVKDAVFVIAGDGPEREHLKSLSERLNIAPSIRWLGWQQDLRRFYSAIDVLLFNTDWDAFPTTPVEGMAHGLPVVASSVHGGLNELIVHSDHGILLEDHDIKRLGEAASALLTDPNIRRNMGRQARARVQSFCDLETCIGNVERLLVGSAGN